MCARPKSNIQRKQTGLRLRPEVYKAVQHKAIDEGLSVSALIERAIEEYLQRNGIEVPPPGEIKP